MYKLLTVVPNQPLPFYIESNSAIYALNEDTIGEISLEEIEHEMIKRCLEKFNGNRRKTAEALNISERTLYRKIKEYEI